MLPTAHAYSSFAAKDIAAEKEFYAKKLGLDVNELYDGQLLELRLGDDKRVLVYSKEDFRPATYTVLNFPVPDVDALRRPYVLLNASGADRKYRPKLKPEGPKLPTR